MSHFLDLLQLKFAKKNTKRVNKAKDNTQRDDKWTTYVILQLCFEAVHVCLAIFLRFFHLFIQGFLGLAHKGRHDFLPLLDSLRDLLIDIVNRSVGLSEINEAV
jgi:hypothetical protein